MRIGILGGAFNPIHNAHLKFARAALKQLKLKKVIFIPENLPPHKTSREFIDAHHRMKMINLAIKSIKSFEISDIEIKRGGISYTIDTVKHLRKKYKCIYYLIGTDMLKILPEWRNIRHLCRYVTFAIAKRPGFSPKLPKIKGLKTVFVNMPPFDISSTKIRKAIKKHKPLKSLPPAVIKYIIKNKLYQ